MLFSGPPVVQIGVHVAKTHRVKRELIVVSELKETYPIVHYISIDVSFGPECIFDLAAELAQYRFAMNTVLVVLILLELALVCVD